VPGGGSIRRAEDSLCGILLTGALETVVEGEILSKKDPRLEAGVAILWREVKGVFRLKGPPDHASS
jgi:hypothetical protein